MRNKDSLLAIALPVTLQSMLQASFSVIDQIMAGQLGTANVAGIGLGGKFSSIYSVVTSAVATAAGIMISQYVGKKDEKGASRSFYHHLLAGMALAIIFTVASLAIPKTIMSRRRLYDNCGWKLFMVHSVGIYPDGWRVYAFHAVKVPWESQNSSLCKCCGGSY